MDRRTFMSLVATASAMPRNAWAQAGSQKVALYAAVGEVLTHYDVDVDGLNAAVTDPRSSFYQR